MVTFKPKSTFTPKILEHNIQTFERVVQRDLEIMENNKYRFKHNLTREENTALMGLAKDRNIVIKPADKGGGIVILDRKDYEYEVPIMRSQLNEYEVPT